MQQYAFLILNFFFDLLITLIVTWPLTKIICMTPMCVCPIGYQIHSSFENSEIYKSNLYSDLSKYQDALRKLDSCAHNNPILHRRFDGEAVLF